MNNWVLCFTTTSTDPERAEISRFVSKKIDTNDYVTGNSIDELFTIAFNKKMKNPVFYCENLTVQGNFIFYYLLKNNYEFKSELKECTDNTFNSLINSDNEIFRIVVYKKRTKKKATKITFIDFQKLVRFNNVSELEKTFNVQSDETDLEYKTDIISKSFTKLFEKITQKNTIGNCSLNDYKEFISEKNFKIWFPLLDLQSDMEMRQCYKGGFTFANPEYIGETIKENGMVLDVNSLYPYIMSEFPLPFGIPLKFTGEYQYNEMYPLYIQNFRCFFELKKNHIPTIQVKHQLEKYSYSDFLTSSDEPIYLSLTNIEMELFLQNYDVYNIEYIDGFMFQSSTLMFKDWVKKWYDLKTEATFNNNVGMRSICKLLLNNLYGKFGTNPTVKNKYPFLKNDIVNFDFIKFICYDDNGNVLINEYTGEIIETPIKYIEPVYIPVAIFVTAWGRYITINTAQKIHLKSIEQTGKSRFLYADTDSIHLLNSDIPENLEIDSYKLGAWKIENGFLATKYLSNKRYIQLLDNGKEKIVCAGLPENYKTINKINFTNFKTGIKFKVKKYHPVKGGVMLTDEFFTL